MEIQDTLTNGNLNQNYSNVQFAQMFERVPEASFDIIHQTAIDQEKDPSQQKVNLSEGIYKDLNGLPYVFQVVKKAEEELIKNIKKEYLKDGFQNFCKAAQKIIFGNECSALKQQRIATMQTLSGTGALYFGFYFISNFLKKVPDTVYLSDPTWATHPDVVQVAGLKVARYPYYDNQIKKINFQKMINFLQTVKIGSIILLQNAGHNPTGADPSQSQWKGICQVMKRRNLIPFFDPAYQGFATGDLQKDAWPIRYFLNQGFLMFVAQSFSKNMGLYGDRIGAIHIVTPKKECVWNVYAAMRSLARKIYLSPPAHGAYVVDRVINNQQRCKAWIKQLKEIVAARIIKMRTFLRVQLQKINTPGTWNHITEQTGMFSFTGLTQQQCKILIEKYHIYLIKNGRIAIPGLTDKNYQYVAKCIKSVIQQTS